MKHERDDLSQHSGLKQALDTKRAYVRRSKQKSATSSQFAAGTVDKHGMKTFYPPMYDKTRHHMPKHPRIQRFNEDFETVSIAPSQKSISVKSGSVYHLMKSNL